jgi:hypothetical protein
MAAVISLCIPVADLEIDCDIEYPPSQDQTIITTRKKEEGNRV